MLKEYDPEEPTGAAPSPCINVCTMNPQTGLCDGCLRTIDEIAGWSSANEQEKRTVWGEIRRRERVAESAANCRTQNEQAGTRK
jgi:predicted Fe-S protein YdhL (DUF1289 family)